MSLSDDGMSGESTAGESAADLGASGQRGADRALVGVDVHRPLVVRRIDRRPQRRLRQLRALHRPSIIWSGFGGTAFLAVPWSSVVHSTEPVGSSAVPRSFISHTRSTRNL